MCIFNCEIPLFFYCLCFFNNLTSGIFNNISILIPCLKLCCRYLDSHFCICTFHDWSNLQTFSPKAFKFEMCSRYSDHIDIPVQATIKCKIRCLRIYKLCRCIVNNDCNYIILFQYTCDVHAPCGIAIVMMCQFFPINIHIRGIICTIDF